MNSVPTTLTVRSRSAAFNPNELTVPILHFLLNGLPCSNILTLITVCSEWVSLQMQANYGSSQCLLYFPFCNKLLHGRRPSYRQYLESNFCSYKVLRKLILSVVWHLHKTLKQKRFSFKTESPLRMTY
jgi:hypothetical protein